jgi:hypothetical protein
MLHRPAQLSHARRDTGLQTGTDYFSKNIGLLTTDCAVLRDSGASANVFEGPDESAYCTRKGKLNHSPSNLGFDNPPFHSARAFAVCEPTRACGEWPIDFHRFHVRIQRPITNVSPKVPREFDRHAAVDRVLKRPCVLVSEHASIMALKRAACLLRNRTGLGGTMLARHEGCSDKWTNIIGT